MCPPKDVDSIYYARPWLPCRILPVLLHIGHYEYTRHHSYTVPLVLICPVTQPAASMTHVAVVAAVVVVVVHGSKNFRKASSCCCGNWSWILVRGQLLPNVLSKIMELGCFRSNGKIWTLVNRIPWKVGWVPLLTLWDVNFHGSHLLLHKLIVLTDKLCRSIAYD